MDGTHERARTLRALHIPGDPLVVVNAWDAVSARVVASAPGCRAIATASWAVAAAHGVRDGALGADAMLAAVARIAAAVGLPVTADLEDGYGDAGGTVARALEAGVVGANLEDGLRPADEHAAEIAAARAAAGDVPFVINARTDEFLLGGRDVAEAVGRGRAYLDAGADCIFVPGVVDAVTIGRLVDELGKVSVLATPASPSLQELARIGVCRVSFGPGAMGLAMAALARAAAELHGRGGYPDDLAFRG